MARAVLNVSLSNSFAPNQQDVIGYCQLGIQEKEIRETIIPQMTIFLQENALEDLLCLKNICSCLNVLQIFTIPTLINQVYVM